MSCPEGTAGSKPDPSDRVRRPSLQHPATDQPARLIGRPRLVFGLARGGLVASPAGALDNRCGAPRVPRRSTAEWRSIRPAGTFGLRPIERVYGAPNLTAPRTIGRQFRPGPHSRVERSREPRAGRRPVSPQPAEAPRDRRSEARPGEAARMCRGSTRERPNDRVMGGCALPPRGGRRVRGGPRDARERLARAPAFDVGVRTQSGPGPLYEGTNRGPWMPAAPSRARD